MGFGLALLPVNSLFLTADVTWQAGSVRLLYALLAMMTLCHKTLREKKNFLPKDAFVRNFIIATANELTQP